MEYTLTKPCGDMCPFRTDCLEGWLGEDRATEIADSLVRSEFPCHKTTEFDEDGDSINSKKEKHCAGALIMLEKMEQPSQMMRICERLGMYDASKLDMSQPIFNSTEEFIEHHT
jgi:hypothetical protein